MIDLFLVSSCSVDADIYIIKENKLNIDKRIYRED